jgi:copper-containing nitrite reductase
MFGTGGVTGTTALVTAAGATMAAGGAYMMTHKKDSGKGGNVNSLMPPHEVHSNLPVEMCPMSFAPDVPPPIERSTPALLRADLTFDAYTGPLTRKDKYEFWGINGKVPGPFLRAMEGDVLEVNVTNNDPSGMPHNIDFHAVDGPGGGAPYLLADQGKTKSAHFHLSHPGIYIYHCAAAPIPMHIANGMYGLLLVEPKGGLPRVDKEFYIMQSEFYLDLANQDPKTKVTPLDYTKGLSEDADAVVFNGREGAMTDRDVLKCKVGDTVRMFVGNGGPNLISSFHVIGTIFEKLYRDGDLISPPARNVQTTLIPPGGATVVEFTTKVPGNLTMVDHALFRLDKGCIGFLMVQGDPQPQTYHSQGLPTPCYGCKVHP